MQRVFLFFLAHNLAFHKQRSNGQNRNPHKKAEDIKPEGFLFLVSALRITAPILFTAAVNAVNDRRSAPEADREQKAPKYDGANNHYHFH